MLKLILLALGLHCRTVMRVLFRLVRDTRHADGTIGNLPHHNDGWINYHPAFTGVVDEELQNLPAQLCFF